MRRFGDRIPVALLIAVGTGILGALYLVFIALRADDSMHFDVTPLSTAFALTAGLAIVAGIAVLLRLGEGSLGARFAFAVGTLVFAVIAMFSIGLAILPIALLLLGFAVRQLVRRAQVERCGQRSPARASVSAQSPISLFLTGPRQDIVSIFHWVPTARTSFPFPLHPSRPTSGRMTFSSMG